LCGVGNKEDDYDETDVNQLTLFINSMWRIVKQKRADEERIRLNEELRISNADLEQFAYITSHDLQEPLRMVSSFTQLLAERYKDKLDKDAHEFIAYAVDGATRMQKLIADLLLYSRIGSRGKSFHTVDPHLVLGKAVVNLKLLIEEANAMVTTGDLPEVHADESQLTTLFQNLIGNGIKFRGATRPKVHISAEKEDLYIHFKVSDNGIGIEERYFSKIFTIFQRLHPTTDYSGTGIGLAVCERIVTRHKGRIWAESELGKGSVFHFTLYAAKGMNDDAESR
ncbi:MAG: hypothetical protein GY852_04425, partial [bacterium]|nr:hypothetical protein [bacterium]